MRRVHTLPGPGSTTIPRPPSSLPSLQSTHLYHMLHHRPGSHLTASMTDTDHGARVCHTSSLHEGVRNTLRSAACISRTNSRTGHCLNYQTCLARSFFLATVIKKNGSTKIEGVNTSPYIHKQYGCTSSTTRFERAFYARSKKRKPCASSNERKDPLFLTKSFIYAERT